MVERFPKIWEQHTGMIEVLSTRTHYCERRRRVALANSDDTAIWTIQGEKIIDTAASDLKPC